MISLKYLKMKHYRKLTPKEVVDIGDELEDKLECKLYFKNQGNKTIIENRK